MIRKTVVFALGLALAVTLAAPSGPVFAMSPDAASATTTDSPLSLLDRIGEVTTDLWLWMGTMVLGTKSTIQEPSPEPLPAEPSEGLTSYGHHTDPNGLD